MHSSSNEGDALDAFGLHFAKWKEHATENMLPADDATRIVLQRAEDDADAAVYSKPAAPPLVPAIRNSRTPRNDQSAHSPAGFKKLHKKDAQKHTSSRLVPIVNPLMNINTATTTNTNPFTDTANVPALPATLPLPSRSSSLLHDPWQPQIASVTDLGGSTSANKPQLDNRSSLESTATDLSGSDFLVNASGGSGNTSLRHRSVSQYGAGLKPLAVVRESSSEA